MDIVLLTNIDFIKSYTNCNDNISDKYLFTALREAQEVDLQRVIGTNLLNKLKSLVSDGTVSDTTNIAYKDLIDKTQFYLAYTTLSKLCLMLSYKMGNFGIITTNDEHINNASFNEILAMKDLYIHKSDTLKYELQLWLLDNRLAFNELTICECNSIQANLDSADSCGLWLGGVRGKKSVNNRVNRCGYDKPTEF